jgi:hypothetical protein
VSKANLPSSVVTGRSAGLAVQSGRTFAVNDLAVSPTGQIVMPVAAFTQGSTYNAAQWKTPAVTPVQRTNEILNGELGIYVPRDWGNKSWRAALSSAVAGTGLATIGIAPADSLCHYDSSDPTAKPWTGLLKAAVQSLGGNAGFGYWPSSLSDYAVNVFAGAATKTAWLSKLWTTTGTWTKAPNGIGNNSLETTVSGSTVTSPSYYGRYVDIYMIEGTAAATWTYSIDGGAAVTVTPGTSNVEVKHTIDCATIGNHTITITFTGSSGTLYFGGGRWRTGGNGVLVDVYGRYGSVSASWIENYGLGWNGGSKQPANLIIAAIGVNDANSGTVTGDVWEQNLRVYLKDALDGTGQTGMSDLAIVMHHIGTNDTTTNLYQDYIARARGIAEGFGAALIDMWAIGNNSWNYWSGLGYWGSGTTLGAAGNDMIHLSDVGHQNVFNYVSPLLLATA